ncbi:RimK family alpha-L-glutamate ligase [Thermodesulfobacteriota bacterium]
MLKAVLFKSEERFLRFKRTLEEYDVHCTVLDFSAHEWIDYNYSKIDFLIYYPSFKYTSNYPLALYEVYDNLTHIKSMYPKLKIYPDPEIIKYYNDKYRQYLFMKNHEYPMPLTYPLLSRESLTIADKSLGYPMVLKNRYGAGGDAVFKVFNKKELTAYYHLSTFNFFNMGSAKHFINMLSQRIFYYHLIKKRKMSYPFLSPPLLAQQYIKIDRDLKTVVGDYKVVEGHWRLQANEKQWKVNIDAGGIGVWGKIPQDAIDLSEKLARELKTNWLNIDIISSGKKFYITEFSPVWHHYAFKEKSSFIYKDDYNIDVPLEISLNLEKIIIESLIHATES